VRNYNQLHIAERQTIEQLLAQGCKVAYIAKVLFRCRSTIKREIDRNSVVDANGNKIYKASLAQKFSGTRKAQSISDHQRKNNLSSTSCRFDFAQRLLVSKSNPKIIRSELNSCFEFHFSSSYPTNKNYGLSIWHERLESFDRRKIYNFGRRRDFQWEEISRSFRIMKNLIFKSVGTGNAETEERKIFSRRAEEKLGVEMKNPETLGEGLKSMIDQSNRILVWPLNFTSFSVPEIYLKEKFKSIVREIESERLRNFKFERELKAVGK
jgi:hypothetical protein